MPFIKPLRTQQDYDAAQARATELVLASPPKNSEAGEELDILATLIAAYDHQHLAEDEKVALKRLRIPSHWAVVYHSLPEAAPEQLSPEDAFVLFSEDLFTARLLPGGILLDLGWHGEWPNGDFRVRVYQGDFHGPLLYEYHSISYFEAVAELERIMEKPGHFITPRPNIDHAQTGSISLRSATSHDLEQIDLIYDHYIHTSTATYQTRSRSDQETAAWFAAHGPQHPVIVAELDGHVVGWGSLSPFHARTAFNRTVEESVYIHHDFHRRGLGKAILAELLKRAKELGHHRVIAAISGDQEPSLALHESMGFTERGRLTEVGFKFGRWLDLVYLEHRL